MFAMRKSVSLSVRCLNSVKRSMATSELTVREAINSAIDEEMARDSKVFVIGAPEIIILKHSLPG